MKRFIILINNNNCPLDKATLCSREKNLKLIQNFSGSRRTFQYTIYYSCNFLLINILLYQLRPNICKKNVYKKHGATTSIYLK